MRDKTLVDGPLAKVPLRGLPLKGLSKNVIVSKTRSHDSFIQKVKIDLSGIGLALRTKKTSHTTYLYIKRNK